MEQSIFDAAIKVKTVDEAILQDVGGSPKIIYIEDIQHSIILFPDGSVFNCNPRDYPLSVKTEVTRKQIEPTLEEYEAYWDLSDDPFLQNDQNCLLWCAFYLERPNDEECSLENLEAWCRARRSQFGN